MESVNTCSGAVVLILLLVVVALQNGQLNFADVESIQDYRNALKDSCIGSGNQIVAISRDASRVFLCFFSLFLKMSVC